MGFERPQNSHHLVIATLGVTLAFGAAAVAGQIVFRDRFGPTNAQASATKMAEIAAARTAAGTAAVTDQKERVVLAAKQLGGEAAATGEELALITADEAKRQVQAGIDSAADKAKQAATAAAQEKWDEAKANMAATAMGVATAAGEKVASSPAITDLKSPEAQRQAQAVSAASVSLWQSLWEVFVSIWHAIVGIFTK